MSKTYVFDRLNKYNLLIIYEILLENKHYILYNEWKMFNKKIQYECIRIDKRNIYGWTSLSYYKGMNLEEYDSLDEVKLKYL